MNSPAGSIKRIVDNKLRGAYGETDLDTKTIRINKQRHLKKTAKRVKRKSDGKEHLGNTILHEELHVSHPRMRENAIRGLTEKKWNKMSSQQKSKLYNRFK